MPDDYRGQNAFCPDHNSTDKKVKDPDASIGVLDPRGSRQMDMPACPLGSLLAGIKYELHRRRL